MPMQRMQEGRRPSMPLQPRSTGTSLRCCCRRPPLMMTMLLTGLWRESFKKHSRALLRMSQISNNIRCGLAQCEMRCNVSMTQCRNVERMESACDEQVADWSQLLCSARCFWFLEHHQELHAARVVECTISYVFSRCAALTRRFLLLSCW